MQPRRVLWWLRSCRVWGPSMSREYPSLAEQEWRRIQAAKAAVNDQIRDANKKALAESRMVGYLRRRLGL